MARDAKPQGGAEIVVVCTAAEIFARTILPVNAGGRALLVVRDGDRLYACDRACPHEYADLGLGRCRAGRLHCPRHRASFDLATGAVSPGWDFAPLKVYRIALRGDDVTVDLSRAT